MRVGGWGAAVLLATAAIGCSSDDEPPLTIGTPSGAYEVVYRVEGAGAERTERLLVRPPFESRTEVRIADEVTATHVTGFDRFRTGDETSPLVVHRVPGPAPADLRVAAVLDPAVAADLLELGDSREVAGRRCRVVRSGRSLAVGPLVSIEAGEHVESCIDAEGILLEEVLFADDEVVLRRTAESVTVDPEVERDAFDPGTVSAHVEQGGGSVLPVDPGVGALGEFWVLPSGQVPDGFEHDGRYAVIPPQPERFGEEVEAGSPIAGTVDVWTRGLDVVVVYQGATLRGDPPFPTVADATEVAAGALGTGHVVLGASASEIRVDRPGGHFVHVAGSLAPDELLALARDLESTEGEGLVYLDR